MTGTELNSCFRSNEALLDRCLKAKRVRYHKQDRSFLQLGAGLQKMNIVDMASHFLDWNSEMPWVDSVVLLAPFWYALRAS